MAIRTSASRQLAVSPMDLLQPGVCDCLQHIHHSNRKSENKRVFKGRLGALYGNARCTAQSSVLYQGFKH